MAKRRILFGSYDTAATGLWTLAEWELSPAEYRQNFVEVPGRAEGDLDLSTALTDGVPTYHNRELTVRLESSEGTRANRDARIRTMVNWLDGWRMNIVLPDDDAHYIVGRVHVAQEYSDPAHAAVNVTAVCEPWRYAVEETRVELTAAEAVQTAILRNQGRKTVVPLLTITTTGTLTLVFGANTWALGAGVYALPDLVLPQGEAALQYSGSGTAVLTYREAVL